MARRQAPANRENEDIPALGSALATFLKASGLDAAIKHPQIEAAWERTVGPEILQHTRVLGFRKGTLEIGVDSSALMSEIGFHRAALLDDLRREIKRPVIAGISFSLIAMQETDERTAETT